MLNATVIGDCILGRMVQILCDEDPIPKYTDHRTLERAEGDRNTMTTATAPSAKELRREAKRLGIEGYEDMTREELTNAVKTTGSADTDTKTRTSAPKAKAEPAPKRRPAKKAPAEKSTSAKPKSTKAAKAEKAPAKKAPAAKAAKAAPEGPNPFRPNTNLWHITEALMRGGKRSALVERLLPKLEYNPRVQSEADFDPRLETDRRLKVVGYLLKNRFGFEYIHDGRGPDATIKVIPPA